jgi:hypothetical protein
MPHKLRFAVLVLAWAAAFYLAIWTAATRLGIGLPYNSGYLPPVFAVMLAARGVPWRRKLLWVAGTLLLFGATDVVAALAGIERIWSESESTSYVAATVGQGLAGVVYHTFSLVCPLAALALFVGRRPNVLWEPAEASVREKKRRTRR